MNLLDLGTIWKATSPDAETFEGRDLTTGDLTWTGSRVDLVFGSNSELRALAEVYASDDAREKFVHDFVAAWVKVMNLVGRSSADLDLLGDAAGSMRGEPRHPRHNRDGAAAAGTLSDRLREGGVDKQDCDDCGGGAGCECDEGGEQPDAGAADGDRGLVHPDAWSTTRAVNGWPPFGVMGTRGPSARPSRAPARAVCRGRAGSR